MGFIYYNCSDVQYHVEFFKLFKINIFGIPYFTVWSILLSFIYI